MKTSFCSVIATALLSLYLADAFSTTNAVGTRSSNRVQRPALLTPKFARGRGLASSPSDTTTVFPIPGKAEKEEKQAKTVAKEEASDDEKSMLSVSTKAAVTMGMVLAFNAGVINSATLSGLLSEGTKQASAAVTGAWTNSALGAASLMASTSSAASSAAIHQFLFNAKCIVCYMFGSVISGLLTPKPQAFKIDVPKSLSTFAIASGLLTTASVLSRASNINYLFLCCLATGIQNSFTSTMSANMCRTCHFSGLTSDMGTFLGQVLRGNLTNMSRLKTSALLCASFWTGGFLAFASLKKFGSTVLLGTAMVHLAFASYLGFKKYMPSKE